jgi:serine/threonine-protein kinase RsbW
MEKAEVVKLEIPGSAEFVAVARKTVEGITSRISITERELEDIKLAVGEACSNAVKFGDPNKDVCILYRIHPDYLEVEVHNKGDHFLKKDMQPKAPQAEQLPEGKIGLYLIEQVMDELNISSENGVTVVKMVKHLSR